MIVEERLVTYLHSLEQENSEILEEIEQEALRDSVPIIRKEMQSFLKLLLASKRPTRILEVGTAVGFSALLMSEYAPEECTITTIENYEKRIYLYIDYRQQGSEAGGCRLVVNRGRYGNNQVRHGYGSQSLQKNGGYPGI